MLPILRRRPVLRAAAISGGAYYAGRKLQEARRRQEEDEARIARLEARQLSTPTAGGMSEVAIQRLERLGRLRETGVLTDEEFAEQKAAVFGH